MVLPSMCGITGIFDTRAARPIEHAVLHRLNESQIHRGPDEGVRAAGRPFVETERHCARSVQGYTAPYSRLVPAEAA